MTALDTCFGNGAEEAHVTTSYENNPHDLLFGMDCQMLGSNPDNCPISTSPSDPNSLTAFFQSIAHPSNNIFQPQPMPASSYHQLLHFASEAPLQPTSFEQTPTDRFPNAHASPQSTSSIFENEAFQAVHAPFEFLPLGAAISSLADSSNIHTLRNHSGLYLPPYYQSFSSQNITQEKALNSQPSPCSTSAAQERLHSASSAVSALESSQSSQGHDRKTQCPLKGAEQDQKEESQPAAELDLALSSCALADTPSVTESAHVRSSRSSRSNKRSHSATPASGCSSQLKLSTLADAIPALRRTSSKNQHKPSNLSISNSSRQDSPKRKSNKLKRNRLDRSCVQPNFLSRSNHLSTPSRTNILANKKIDSNILPPTPDSLQRTKNQCPTTRDDLDSAEESGSKKKQKIESIERALEALDTLTEYLSQEANESSFNSDGATDHRNQLSPSQHHCNSNLSLVSPQHFFTLGELGGRLRRRLDVHRR